MPIILFWTPEISNYFMPTVRDRNYIASGAITPKLREIALSTPKIGLMELLQAKVDYNMTDYALDDVVQKMHGEYAHLPLHIILYVEGYSEHYYKFI